LAVRNAASETTQFISVMGSLGEHLAVAFYPSRETLDNMQSEKKDFQDSVDCIMSQRHLQLVFDRKNALLPGEAGTIKKSGIAFGKETDGMWPSAQSLVPGYSLLKAGGEELERMLEGLEQLLCKLDAKETIPEMTSPFAAICTRSCVDGVWQEAMQKHELKPDDAQGVYVSDEMAEAFHNLPAGEQELVCACFTMPIPFGKSKNRDIIPRIMITMDRKTGKVVNVFPSTPPPGKVWTLTQAFTAWLQGVIDRGVRPASICFEGWYLHPLAPSLCQILDIKEDARPCPEIDSVFQSFVMNMTTGRFQRS
jgi:hypothetical protein